jgi:uncharacterized protein DUF1844
MTPSEPEEPSFKVTDRRRRVEDEEPSSPPTQIEPPRLQPEPVESSRPASRRAETASTQAAPERDLTGLFVMLASSAALSLGEAPDPMTGQVHRDLPQAAELIDLLALLRAKTEGNRTSAETQVLDEVLYDLQLRYVSAMKRAAPGRGPSRS